MHAPSRLLALLAAAAHVASVLAVPAPAVTDAWVTVDESGKIKTVTPVATTIDGTATVISASPTTTVLVPDGSGQTTSADQPKAAATDGAGAFPVCHNTDGALAPFCAPSDRTTLNPGKTYYITWDTAYFSASPNTSLVITGNFYNATTGQVTNQAFTSPTLSAGWSFYAWTVDKALLSGAGKAGVNISMSLVYLASANNSTVVQGPLITVANERGPLPSKSNPPTGAALYIGLPCILAFVIIVLVGTCLWNRKTRRIELGNIMSRSRFGPLGGAKRSGYSGRKARRQRMEASLMRGGDMDAKDDIYLQNRYQDEDRSGSKSGHSDTLFEAPPSHARHGSDGLGSLAGTPTDERFGGDVHRPAHSGNVFRDEVARQNESRLR